MSTETLETELGTVAAEVLQRAAIRSVWLRPVSACHSTSERVAAARRVLSQI